MKVLNLLLALAFGWLGLAVRLETDCPPKEKCFTGTNECHAVYSSCWDECLLGSVAPTVTPPACTEAVPAIVFAEQARITGTGTDDPCRPGVVCIDGLAFCGNVTAKWGGCYETCSGIQPTAPSCSVTTLPLMTGTAPVPTTRTRRVRSSTSRGPCTYSQAWRCAPPGW